MNVLWTAAALRTATGGSLPGEAAITGVSIDSRAIAAGDLFIALRDARDGHDFVADALARGAAAAMVDHDPPGTAPGAPLLRVADTLAGLTALGAAGRARSNARVLAVTGSVGKTTTKEMLRTLCAALGPVHAAVASFNNHWGVPLTLARLPLEARHAIIEIGMNNPGEIAPLARLARPHIACISNIGTAHIGHLGSQEAIAREKAAILLGLEPGGAAVLPRDSDFFPLLAEAAGSARIISFGRHPDAALRLLEASITPEGTVARLAWQGREFPLHMAGQGLHLAENAAAALASLAALGEDPLALAPALAGYVQGAGRGRPLPIPAPGGQALLLDDSYNASNASVRAALAVLAAQAATRRIAVLGEMRELGEHGPALHADLAGPAAAAADLVFCCGAQMRHLWDALPAAKQGAFALDSAALAPQVQAALRAGDAVLVKGSLGSRMATVIRALTTATQGGAS